MAATGKPFWTSDAATGPAGKFHVAVLKLRPGQHPLGRRDLYTATLYRKGDDGDVAVEADFWQHTTPPHDADKIIFREKARKASAGAPAAGAEGASQAQAGSEPAAAPGTADSAKPAPARAAAPDAWSATAAAASAAAPKRGARKPRA